MHLMIDFETLDTAPSAAVVSLGATFFLKHKVLKSKYWEFNLDDQFKQGRTVSESTLRWWFGQSEAARKPLMPKSDVEIGDLWLLDEFVEDFIAWAEAHLKAHKTNWKGLNVWGNGACFDPPLLDNIIRSQGKEIPYVFWQVICYRTFDKMFKIKNLVEREGTHHNAMDDAIYQAETVIAYYEKRGKK